MSDEEEEYPECEDAACFICGGEGYVEGDIPLWNEGELEVCYSCGGSGLKKDMTCY